MDGDLVMSKNAKRPGNPEQKKKKEELWSKLIESEPIKGNATSKKGWRTINPLSD